MSSGPATSADDLIQQLDRVLEGVRAAYRIASGPLAAFQPTIMRVGKELAALREDVRGATAQAAARADHGDGDGKVPR